MGDDDLRVVDRIGDTIKNAIYGIPDIARDQSKRALVFVKNFRYRELLYVRKHWNIYKKVAFVCLVLYTVRHGFRLGGIWAVVTGAVLWIGIIAYLLHRFCLMRVIGFTGGIATGKSMCTKELTSSGAQVVDLDTMSHELYYPGMPAWSAIRREFGDEVLWRESGDGSPRPESQTMRRRVHKNNDRDNHASWTVNRPRLGQIVFNDPRRRKALNWIMMWPLTKALVSDVMWYFCVDRKRRVVLDAPLLYEKKLHWICDHVVCVNCKDDQQLRRLCARDSISETQARQRIAAQMTQDEKTRMAHLWQTKNVIRNVGDKEATYRQLNEWWWAEEKLNPSKPSRLSLLTASLLTPVLYLLYRFIVWL